MFEPLIMAAEGHHHHRKINLGDCETEEEILDAIETSRKITRLVIQAVQKGSKFEVSQILDHYGLAMSTRLHFKVVNTLMEQWFSLIGLEDEEQILSVLQKNKAAMARVRTVMPKGTLAMSDLLSEWELPIGGLQSKIIRRLAELLKEEDKDTAGKEETESGAG